MTDTDPSEHPDSAPTPQDLADAKTLKIQEGGPAAADRDDAWEVVAAHLETFLSAWEESGEAPDIRNYLPDGDVGDATARLTLVELIKADLEYRVQRGISLRRLEWYFDACPGLLHARNCPADLILEEVHRRQAANEHVSAGEIRRRFPQAATGLSTFLGLDDSTADSSTPLDTLQPGMRVGDFYLMTELGRGGFGHVFLARQEAMQRLVALKISRGPGTEGQTLARLDHPNIVRVYDQSTDPERQLQLLFMQFVPGGTLERVIQLRKQSISPDSSLIRKAIRESVTRTGILSADHITLRSELLHRPWPEAVAWLGAEIATALYFAHRQGVLHRDLKPANVLLEPGGTARLADFNVSYCDSVDPQEDRNFGGSLLYMSPEQLDACHPTRPGTAADVDARSDIYALGLLLQELLTGQRSISSDGIPADWVSALDFLRLQRLNHPSFGPESGATGDGAVSPVELRLRRIIARCLRPNPEDRYSDAGAVVRELRMASDADIAELLNQSEGAWPQRIIRYPLTSIATASLLPNVVAGIFNFVYNEQAIVANISGAEAAFWRIQFVINVVAFPLGFALVAGRLFDVIREFRVPGSILSVRSPTPQKSGATLHGAETDFWARFLTIGQYVAIVSIVEWIVAGVAYPVSLHWLQGGLAGQWYLHFFSSLVICGMVAAAYPFFLLSAITTRVFLPMLLRDGALDSSMSTGLARLAARVPLCLYLAGGVPAIGILMLEFTGAAEAGHTRMALRVLSVLGAFGFALILWLTRRLQRDLESLRRLVRILSR